MSYDKLRSNLLVGFSGLLNVGEILAMTNCGAMCLGVVFGY